MSDDLRPGWLDEQLRNVSEDVANWPEWMRVQAGLRPGPSKWQRRAERWKRAAKGAHVDVMQLSDHCDGWVKDNARLEAENCRLRAALALYADAANWEECHPNYWVWGGEVPATQAAQKALEGGE